MNLETINKWLDNEYGVSYTRLEELHDFVVEQDLKHQEKAQKEIDRLNKVLKYLEKHFQEKEEYENAELVRQLKEANIEWLENALGDEE